MIITRRCYYGGQAEVSQCHHLAVIAYSYNNSKCNSCNDSSYQYTGKYESVSTGFRKMEGAISVGDLILVFLEGKSCSEIKQYLEIL